MQNSSTQPGLRRLSINEMDNMFKDVLGDNTQPAKTRLPPDPRVPFDNDISAQLVSIPLIEGLDQLAQDVASRLIADVNRRDSVLGCVPTKAEDSNCMHTLIDKLATKMFRQTLDPSRLETLNDFALTQAKAENNFYAGVDVILRYLIEHPSFLYRYETGVLQNGKIVLTPSELASRLSFLIWGSGPDQQLMDAAQSGDLVTVAQIRAQALRLLNDSRATQRVEDFHAMWLAYENLPHETELSQSMKAEANEMVARIVFTEDRPWIDLLKLDQTKIDDNMRELYGLPQGGNSTWTNFPVGRRGILSTGAFLSVAPKFGDTSPTQRGKFIRERILCQKIPPPPPTTNVDSPPPQVDSGSNCKIARYEQHRRSGSTCFACHQQMDPIGFGLERYDRFGRFREFDQLADGSPNESCPIDGTGSIAEIGNFNGPSGLSDLLIQSEKIEPCLIQQFYHFAFGQVPGTGDQAFLNHLQLAFKDSGGKFKDLILATVTAEEFRTRGGQ